MFELNSKSKLLAVDPSLRATGWAIFRIQDSAPISVGVISAPPAEFLLAERLHLVQSLIEELLESFQFGKGDVLICEGPAPAVLNPESTLKVERVRGIFETLGRYRGVVVPGRINPRTVQTELLGMKGKQKPRVEVKAWAREIADRLYPGHVTEGLWKESEGRKKKILPQDIIDALLIGSVALSKLHLALASGTSLESAFNQRSSGGNQRQSRGGNSRGSRVNWSEREWSKAHGQ